MSEHDERCQGYGGWWARNLDGGAVGWAVSPETQDDKIGYVVCSCMTTITPCPSTATSVLGMVGEPAEVRCGLLAGHDGPHQMHMEWTEDT